jgi:hypothetical protein
MTAIEKRQDRIEETLEAHQDCIGNLCDDYVRQQKSINVLEGIQRGEGPEVCECRCKLSYDDCQKISIAILGNRHHTNVFRCPDEAMAWCEKVLDSMGEG